MPSNWLYIDTNFPSFTGEEPANEKINTIMSYLFQLRECLQYMLHNLDLSNMNQTAVSKYTTSITQPLYARIEDAEGNLTQLELTAKGLSLRVSDAEENITSLEVTAKGLSTRVSDAEGNISTLTQTAQGLTTRVSDAEGNISTLTQTAQGLTTRVSSAEGNISSLTQTAKGLSTRVSDAEGNISSLEQYVNSLTLSVSNGTDSSTIKLMAGRTELASKEISLSGMVTFNDLSTSGRTTIYGGNIDTSTLKVKSLYGTYVNLNTAYGYTAGRISITGAATADTAIDISSYGALRLDAGAGDVYLESGWETYVQISDTIAIGNGDLASNRNGMYSCGTSTRKWTDVYCTNSASSTSDLRKKKDVEYALDAYEALFDRLRPISFLFRDGTSGRRHLGLGAQDVERAIAECGLTDMDFAGLVRSPGETEGEYDYFLRYGEFIPMCVDQIQKLKARVAELEQSAQT